MIELMFGPFLSYASIRARYDSTSLLAVSCFDRCAAWMSLMLASMSLNGALSLDGNGSAGAPAEQPETISRNAAATHRHPAGQSKERRTIRAPFGADNPAPAQMVGHKQPGRQEPTHPVSRLVGPIMSSTFGHLAEPIGTTNPLTVIGWEGMGSR